MLNRRIPRGNIPAIDHTTNSSPESHKMPREPNTPNYRRILVQFTPIFFDLFRGLVQNDYRAKQMVSENIGDVFEIVICAQLEDKLVLESC